MTLTGINVFPLWSHNISTVTPNTKTASSKISCRTCFPGIRPSEFLRLWNLGVLQIFFKKNNILLRKGINNSLWVGWYRKDRRSASAQRQRWTLFETVIYGLGHLGRIGCCKSSHMWFWKREFSRSGRGRMRSRHPKQLCFWKSK